MKGLSKIEVAILVSLDKILTNNEDVKLGEIGELVETDEILKIRELVYHLDLLSQKEYIEVEKDYYAENESVAFNYVNSAVSIDLTKIKLTEKSLEKLREHELSKTPFSERTIFTVITYLLTFVLGMMSMYIIK
ncbi:MAG: hypothetical protein WBA54_05045 [Acidaminobacteraceae bacterium]